MRIEREVRRRSLAYIGKLKREAESVMSGAAPSPLSKHSSAAWDGSDPEAPPPQRVLHGGQRSSTRRTSETRHTGGSDDPAHLGDGRYGGGLGLDTPGIGDDAAGGGGQHIGGGSQALERARAMVRQVSKGRLGGAAEMTSLAKSDSMTSDDSDDGLHPHPPPPPTEPGSSLAHIGIPEEEEVEGGASKPPPVLTGSSTCASADSMLSAGLSTADSDLERTQTFGLSV